MREVFECAVLQAPDQAGPGLIDGGDRLKLHAYGLDRLYVDFRPGTREFEPVSLVL